MTQDFIVGPVVNIDVAQERAKPRLVSILFFDHYNQTATGKVNLLGIFDRIYANPETKRTPPFGVFIRT